MKNLIKIFSRLLYGGVSCYCLQRFIVDIVNIKNFESDLLQTGDLIILDIWNRAKLERQNLIYAKSPDDHKQILLGHIMAYQDEYVNTQSRSSRIKAVKVPKGSVAIKLLSNDDVCDLRILPIGLIEGRVLARIWPLKRFNSHMLNASNASNE